MNLDPSLPPRRGRRDNGLDAPAFTSLGDVDPRVGEHLLEVLRDAGIAAYLEPYSELNPYWRATALPSPPRDRLFVDRDYDARAADLVTEHADEPEPDPRPASGDTTDSDTTDSNAADSNATDSDAAATPSTTTSAFATPERSVPVDDSVWAELVAAFDRAQDPGDRPWPEAEDLPPRRERTDPRDEADRPDDDRVPDEWDLGDPPKGPSGSPRGPSGSGPDEFRGRTLGPGLSLGPFTPGVTGLGGIGGVRPPGSGNSGGRVGPRGSRPGPAASFGVPGFGTGAVGGRQGSGGTGEAGGAGSGSAAGAAGTASGDRTSGGRGGRTGGRSDVPDLSDLPSLEGEPANDPDEHYQPPPPPPFPTPSAATMRALTLLLAGVVLLVAPTIIGVGGETGFVLGVLGIVSGLGLLVFRLRERPPPGDGDNGAVV